MRTPMEHSGFPSDETLAAFIDGKLDPETRTRVVEHMAQCPECYETFLGAGVWGRTRHESEKTARNSKRRIWYAMPVAIAAALATALFITPVREGLIEYRFQHRTGLSRLVTAA